jgi:hypothetical protein
MAATASWMTWKVTECGEKSTECWSFSKYLSRSLNHEDSGKRNLKLRSLKASSGDLTIANRMHDFVARLAQIVVTFG